jgi:hypothetical protein
MCLILGIVIGLIVRNENKNKKITFLQSYSKANNIRVRGNLPKDHYQSTRATNYYISRRRKGKVYVDPIHGFIEEDRLRKQILKEESIDEEKIVAVFKVVPEVDSIYCLPASKKIIILTNNKKYDDELMDRLLNVEYTFTNNLKYIIDFKYIPTVLSDGTIHPNAKLLYKRR